MREVFRQFDGCGYVECERGIELPYQVPTEPDFLNFVFKFYRKSQIKKFGGERKRDSRTVTSAFRIHIGAVMA